MFANDLFGSIGFMELKIIQGDLTNTDISKEILEGNAVAGWCSYTHSERWAKENNAEAWYTERNGDPITLLVPKGTDPSKLPKWCKGYIIFEWIRPDKEFGSGVMMDHKCNS